MEIKYLPIGSVVILEGGTKPLMVTGYKMKEKEDSEKIYDYVGCVFPEGFMEEVFSLFDNNQIKDVLFVGYEDEEAKDMVYNITNGIAPSVEYKEDGKKPALRKPIKRPPTKPLSSSEMFARYTKEVISGGETEKFNVDDK